MIGLGRMGANMVRRLMKGGHRCVVYNRSQDSVKQLVSEGATGSTSLEDFVKKLEKPRTAWMMVPAGAPTEETVRALAELLEPGDVAIDGGNSTSKTTSDEPKCSDPRAFITWMSAPVAAF